MALCRQYLHADFLHAAEETCFYGVPLGAPGAFLASARALFRYLHADFLNTAPNVRFCGVLQAYFWSTMRARRKLAGVLRGRLADFLSADVTPVLASWRHLERRISRCRGFGHIAGYHQVARQCVAPRPLPQGAPGMPPSRLSTSG